MVQIVVQRILMMLLIIVIGFIACKVKLLSKEGGKQLSNLLMYIVNPLLILLSFQQSFEMRLLKNFLLVFLISFLALALMTLASHFLVRKEGPDRPIERYALIYGNCGFFGIPIVNSIYGAEGIFYLTAFMAAFNIFNWSLGITMMKGNDEKMQVREVLRNLVNPTIIGTVIGFGLFLSSITLPGLLSNGLQLVADMNTPLAMIVAGIALSQNKISEVIKNRRLPLIVLLLLVVSPAIVIIPLYFIPVAVELKVIVSIACACPAGTTINTFALKFDKNAGYAAQIYSISTICSAITIPLFLLLYSLG
ncbi:MAG: AEC family transporter [Lachnospiraceae bacterium]